MSYNINARCGNCGHKWSPNVPKGTNRFLWSDSAPCPHCETTGSITTSAG